MSPRCQQPNRRRVQTFGTLGRTAGAGDELNKSRGESPEEAHLKITMVSPDRPSWLSQPSVATTGEAMPEARRKIYVKSKEKSLCVASATLLVHGLRFVESEEETSVPSVASRRRGAGLGSLVIAPECYKAEAHLQQCSTHSTHGGLCRRAFVHQSPCFTSPLLHPHPIPSHLIISSLISHQTQAAS